MKKKNNKAEANLKSEHYTNLMLLTVVEAMVLLIGQLVIFNAFQIIQTFTPMWTTVTPVLFGISLAGAVISSIPFFMGKKGFMPVCKFFVYVTLMFALIRYIPNNWSKEYGFAVNPFRGQLIAAVTSVIYIAASFVYYCREAKKAEKKLK